MWRKWGLWLQVPGEGFLESGVLARGAPRRSWLLSTRLHMTTEGHASHLKQTGGFLKKPSFKRQQIVIMRKLSELELLGFVPDFFLIQQSSLSI